MKEFRLNDEAVLVNGHKPKAKPIEKSDIMNNLSPYHFSPDGKELKPCPFCGARAAYSLVTNGWIRIECQDCECGTDEFAENEKKPGWTPMLHQEMADKWNRRTHE